MITVLSAAVGFIHGAVLLPGAFFIAKPSVGWLLRIGPTSLMRLTSVLPALVCVLALLAGYALSASLIILLAQGDPSLRGILGQTMMRWSIVGLGAFLIVLALRTHFSRRKKSRRA